MCPSLCTRITVDPYPSTRGTRVPGTRGRSSWVRAYVQRSDTFGCAGIPGGYCRNSWWVLYPGPWF
eukprot:3345247-Rhodomonas_salina.1